MASCRSMSFPRRYFLRMPELPTTAQLPHRPLRGTLDPITSSTGSAATSASAIAPSAFFSPVGATAQSPLCALRRAATACVTVKGSLKLRSVRRLKNAAPSSSSAWPSTRCITRDTSVLARSMRWLCSSMVSAPTCSRMGFSCASHAPRSSSSRSSAWRTSVKTASLQSYILSVSSRSWSASICARMLSHLCAAASYAPLASSAPRLCVSSDFCAAPSAALALDRPNICASISMRFSCSVCLSLLLAALRSLERRLCCRNSTTPTIAPTAMMT
mmetsp:Transcript_35430/g.92058  ORF Transcript_35430/g.92058 Transcript_35430/m.92058 type:complete len:273 (-) Transcript_35430:224-1042(-)